MMFSSGYGLNEGICARAGLNFDTKWYKHCESFSRHYLETSRENEDDGNVSPFREDGTLKASFYDFPELEKRESKSSGCYIATAVYGSYDCPEVWTLRRYRDYYLDRSLRGRIFIRLYYSVSPLIVKIFGKSKFFKKTCRKILNAFISHLVASGIESTPYHGK